MRNTVIIDQYNYKYDCPEGLEYLGKVDQLQIMQQIELMEIISGYQTNNLYTVHNERGEQIFFAREDTDFCIRNCCESARSFTIYIEDNQGEKLTKITRPYKCICCCQCFSCSECCKDEIEVEAPLGNTIGYVKELCQGCGINYEVQNSSRETVLKIHGPLFCYCFCPGEDIHFQILSADNSNQIGTISKLWPNSLKNILSNANNFMIKFPIDLDIRIKAIVVGAVFLIDLMYFEDSTDERC